MLSWVGDQPDVYERVSKVVRGAAERGEREVMVVRFPSTYCPDGGRAINNFEAGWENTLTGFASARTTSGRRSWRCRATSSALRSWISPAVPGDLGLSCGGTAPQ